MPGLKKQHRGLAPDAIDAAWPGCSSTSVESRRVASPRVMPLRLVMMRSFSEGGDASPNNLPHEAAGHVTGAEAQKDSPLDRATL